MSSPVPINIIISTNAMPPRPKVWVYLNTLEGTLTGLACKIRVLAAPL